jgi:hypothetical protein
VARRQAEAAAAAAADMRLREARVARTIEETGQAQSTESGDEGPAPEDPTGETAGEEG